MSDEPRASHARHDEQRELDPRSLRALAHPLRIRLLNALRADGPATASQLAERFGESSGSTSYHLRQLEEHGFVEEEEGRGTARERYWRSVHRGTSITRLADLVEDPEARGPLDVFLHEVASLNTQELGHWIATQGEWSREWIESSTISDFSLRLDPARLEQLLHELFAVLERYRAEPSAAPDAERVRLHLNAFPTRSQKREQA